MIHEEHKVTLIKTEDYKNTSCVFVSFADSKKGDFMNYFFDEAGNIRTELLDEKAKEVAESFVERNPRDQKRLIQKRSLSSAQLRRFFNEFRQLEKKVKTTENFDKVKPLIKMVKSKASYAANPSNPKIPQTFKDFLINNVNKINTAQDFEVFMLHFEAVVGFFYGIEGVSNN